MKRFELSSWNLIMSCSWTMWKVSIVPEWIKKWIINQALLAIKPSNKLLNKYLKLYMESWVFQEEITKHSKWAAIKNIASIKILKQIKIPLPPLPIQKQIVSHLDKVFQKNKALKESYEKKLKDLEEMKQSLLKEAFEGRLVKE
jgi:type I restriction enzyme S subunit